jgi:hypothetical protein
MKLETVLAQIETEFSAAREALTLLNDGRARVCARRAAGKAVAWFLIAFPHPAWGNDAMTQLRALSADGSFPDAVRTAALRLTTKIDPQFSYPSPVAAIDDAQAIVAHILKKAERADVR